MNLWECLRYEFENNGEFWNYYRVPISNPFMSEWAAREFIREYFGNGSKADVAREWMEFDVKDLRFRDTHMIYVFFIGVMLQYIIDPNLKIESVSNDEGYPFSYLWFITCLAHDFGYIYESQSIDDELEGVEWICPHFREKRYMGIYQWHKMMYRKICPKIWGISPSIPFCMRGCFYTANRHEKVKEMYDSCGRTCKGTLQYSNGTQIGACWYSQGLKSRYFRYRLLHRRKLDHGIVGADKFYGDMVKNYRKNFREELRQGTFENFENTNKRHFSCEQFKVFAHVADCIASHNIFCGEEDEASRKVYEEYDLQKLLPENFVKISYSKNPLLFILCVADTLEPTKKFRDIEPKEVLENMEIHYDVDSNSIYLNISE